MKQIMKDFYCGCRDILKDLSLKDNLLSQNHVFFVLLLSGFFGFCLGIFAYPSLQDAVEPAQVVSGVVQYPPGNPQYVYSVKIWTIIQQICALFIRLGLSEKVLSFFLSGIIGMLAYQALALSLLSLSRNILFSIIAPFFIHYTGPFSSRGVTYPIWLMSEFPCTYAIIWLSYILLVAALISLKQYKLGGFLLGLTPAVHPSVGLWFIIIVFFCFIWDFRNLSGILKEMGKYIIIGFLISFISLTMHLFFMPTYNLPHIDSSIASKYLSAFLNHWDAHRFKFPLVNLWETVPGFFMFLLWVFFKRKDLPGNSIFLLRCSVISVIIGAIFSLVYWLPAEKAPSLFLIMTPSRLFNFVILASVVLLLGLLWRYKNNYLCQLIFTIFAISSYPKESSPLLSFVLALIVLIILKVYLLNGSSKSLVRSQMASGTLRAAGLIILGSVIFSAGIARILRVILRLKPEVLARYFFTSTLALVAFLYNNKGNSKSLFQSQAVLVPLRRIILVILCLSIILLGARAIWTPIRGAYSLRDATNDRFFAEVHKRPGLLLTGSNIKLIQLRTRRPVLLDGGSLDSLPYVLESGPEMNRILQQVYGTDIFNPPKETKRRGALSRETGKVLWESRVPAQWVVIAKQFGITDVLTYADWKLQLPKIVSNSTFVLYTIPDQIK